MQTITIKTGPHKGVWALMHKTGFGSKGASAQYRMVGKSGKLLAQKTLNLTSEQVAQVEAA